MSLIDLISRHAVAVVFGLFVLVALVSLAGIFLGRLVWRQRQAIWKLVSAGFRAVGKLPPVAWLRRRFPRVFAALGKRLTPQEFLGVYLVAGLLLSAGVLFFVSLSQRILGESSLAAFDAQLASALQEAVRPRTFTVLSNLTTLGGGPALTTIGVGIGLMLLLRRYWNLLLGWLLALAGGGFLNQALKALYQRARPEYAVDVGGWSFPSGHAMGSFITYGMLAYLAIVFLPRRVAQIIAAALLLFVLFIGFSRIYLGVHYFSDVVAGYSAAIVWLVICISGTEIARLRAKRGRGKTESAPSPVVG